MRYLLPLLTLVACAATSASDDVFTMGPIFTDYGPVANVDITMALAPDTTFNHSFDVSVAATAGEPNRALVSAARFINMHARAGIAEDDIEVAIVVHGPAVKDMAGELSTSAGLIAALSGKGVKIIVCGQSAAHFQLATDDLLPGVQMALSAMTAHAVLQQQGYTVNPF